MFPLKLRTPLGGAALVLLTAAGLRTVTGTSTPVSTNVVRAGSAAPVRYEGPLPAGPADPLLTVTAQATHNPDYNFATASATLRYSTPAYFSMDAARSVQLIYTSEQAHPMGLVQLTATDLSGVLPAYYALRLVRPNSSLVTFTNGATQVYYAGGVTSRPITAQFDASSLTTGAYSYTAVVAAVYADSSRRETSLPVRVVVLNESTSEVAWGWSVAGANRLYLQTDGAVVTNGMGKAAFFPRSCSSCAFSAPPGDFSKLRVSGTTYIRTYPDSTRETYNSAGRLVYLDDRIGNRTTFAYSSSRLASIQDPAGLTTSFGYNTAGKLATVTTPGGRVVQVTVDGSGNLTTVQDRGTALQATYHADRRLATHTSRNSGVSNYYYHSTGALDSLQLPSLEVLRNGVDVAVRPTYRYRSFEEAVAPPAGTGTAASHAPQVASSAVLLTDPRGNVTTSLINKFGLPLSVSRPGGGTTLASYDADGNRTFHRDPNGREAFAWWTGARLDSTRDASTGRRIRYQYGAFSQVTQITTDSVTQDFTLNAQGLVRYASVNGGGTTEYAYDTHGRVTEITDPIGHKTRAYYSATGWLNTDSIVGDTVGQKTVFTYDTYGRVRTVRNAVNEITTSIPDALNRDSVLISPASDTTRYAYTGEFMTSVTLPGGAVYGTTVNALGWVRTQTSPGPGTFYRHYDENGNVVKTVNRRSQAVTFAFDAMNRMTARTADGQTATFAYDSLGLWTASSNAEATDTIWFNSKGQKVRAVTALAGWTWQRRYGYDSSGRPTYMRVDTDRGRDWYWEDAQGCDSLWPEGGGLLPWAPDSQYCLNTWQINHQYDLAGNYSQMQVRGDWLYGDDEQDLAAYYTVFTSGATFGFNADRMLTSTTVGTLTFSQGYDRQHSLHSLTFSQDSINTLLGGTYQRDLLGRTLNRYNPAQTGLKWYAYDARGQVYTYGTGVKYMGQWSQGEIWDSPFDRYGNPADSGAYVGTGNRLSAYRGYGMTYDADGNIEIRDNDQSIQYYVWNALGQLVAWENYYEQLSAGYGYDARGRRVSKVTDGDTTYYLYDGNNLIAEIAPRGNVKRIYTYYPGTDRPHSMVQNDSVYYYLTDEPGHVVGLVRPNGSLANRYEYTPFGEARFVRETVPNDLRFNARQLDESGLYYFRARYYDPFIRRFMSEDPLGLWGGANLYAYAGNDPVNLYDASGMSASDADCRWELRYEPVQGLDDRDGDRYEWKKVWVCPLEPVTVTADPEDPYEGNPDWEDVMNEPEGPGMEAESHDDEILAMAKREWLEGCPNQEFALALPMGNMSSRAPFPATVGVWNLTFRRRYNDYRILGVRVPGLDNAKYSGTYFSQNYPQGVPAQATVLCGSGWVFLSANGGRLPPDYQRQ